MLRAIREIQPRWIVGENVYGLVNWDGGLVFEQVQADLENEGYEVQPYILPAASVNAPHRRDRVWFVAHRNHRDGKEVGLQTGRKKYMDGLEGTGAAPNTNQPGLQATRAEQQATGAEQHRELGEATSADSRNKGLPWRKVIGSAGSCRQERHKQPAGRVCPNWDEFPTQPPVRGIHDGISARLAGITVSKHRNESIKAYGNAIVPQVALQIFKAIEKYEYMYYANE